MENVRHEEYVGFADDLPFYFQPRIVRTSTVFSTARNWHENVEFQFCIDGKGEVLLDGESFGFEKGDVIAVNPNVIHYTKTDDYLEYSCLIVDNAFLEKTGFDIQGALLAPRISRDAKLNGLRDELERIYASADEFRRPLLNSVLLRFLIETYRNHSAERTFETKRTKRFEEIKNTVIFLRANYFRKLSLDEIAKNVLTDKFTLSKEFKKFTGQTIVDYLNGYRIKKAALLIARGSNVSDAAYACGFENMSYFTRLFKSTVGALPSSLK